MSCLMGPLICYLNSSGSLHGPGGLLSHPRPTELHWSRPLRHSSCSQHVRAPEHVQPAAATPTALSAGTYIGMLMVGFIMGCERMRAFGVRRALRHLFESMWRLLNRTGLDVIECILTCSCSQVEGTIFCIIAFKITVIII